MLLDLSKNFCIVNKINAVSMKIFQVLITASLVVLCNLGYAQNNCVVDKDLQIALERDFTEKISVNIVLKSQMEPARIKRLSVRGGDKHVVRGLMVNELKEHSHKNQKAVLGLLLDAAAEERVANIKTHWVVNMITCDATKDVIEALASHSDVLVIGCNKEIQVVNNYEVADYASYRAVSPHSATSHILQVNADDVWAQGYTGKNVVVAILDSGTNPDHYDLKDHLWSGYADTDGDGEEDDLINGWNFISNNHDIKDDYGHGTHCAGIVCGDGTVGNVTGVAPDATLMTVKVVNRAGGGTPAQMISGVQFAVENGADVLSMSLGFKQSQISETDIVLLRKTFEQTLLLGVPVCAAVGNDGDSYGAPYNVDYPAACPPPYLHPDQQVNAGSLTSVISVGSVNASDEYVNSSSRGPVTWQGTSFADYLYDAEHIGLIRPDISAPGNLVYSLKHDSNDKYKYMSGTSQATPCVAGVIALMLEKNPTLTPAQICETIETTAKKLSDTKNNYTGSGRIDALAAINAVDSENERPFIRVVDYSPISMAAGNDKEITFMALNTGKGASKGNVCSVLSTADSYVTIVNGVVNHGEIAAGESAEGVFVVNVSDDAPNGHTAYMRITTSDGVNEWNDDVVVSFNSSAKIVYRSSSPGVVKPGKDVVISVEMINSGTVATVADTKVKMESSSPYVTITSGEAELGVMDVGEVQTVEFVVDIDESIPDNNSISFDIYATPNNYTTTETLVYEFESGLDANGYVIDGLNSWTTFDASNDGRNHPWWHSSVAATHKVESVGDAYSGTGQMMSETYCQASMMDYTMPIDNYLVSPKVRVAAGSKFSFWARVHSNPWFGEHFGVAVSESANNSATDFVMLDEWTITKDDGTGWRQYTVDLSAYEGKDVYVAIRHFFTNEQWAALDNGYDVYILHVDDAMFHDVVDVSTDFVYENYSYFSLTVEGNPLPAPSNVVANAISSQSVKISWGAVKNAQRYNIYRDGVYVANTTGLEYTDMGLSSDTEYGYTIAAVYNNKEYEHSAVAKVTTGKADYSVKVKAVVPSVLSVGENTLQITMVNNGRYEQESKSDLFLTTSDPYVQIVIDSVRMAALNYVGKEDTKEFAIVVDKLVPNGHKIQFNINVKELFVNKNSWDCPFVVTVENEDRELLLAEAKAFVDGWGVGYPDEEAKQAYCNAVDAAVYYSDIDAAKAALRVADVKMPVDGGAYYIKAKYSDGCYRYLYNNGTELSFVADEGKPDGYSGVFVMREVTAGKYALVNNAGGYMVYCGGGKEGAGGVVNGFVYEYEQGENDAEITFVAGARLTATNPATVDVTTEFFGGFAMQAYNNSYKEPYYMTVGAAGFSCLSSNSICYDENNSSVFYLEEVGYPNTPKLNGISGSTLITGIDESGLASFSAPFPVLIPDDMTVYYAQKIEENFVSLVEYTGEALPANEGVLLAGVVGEVVMKPALNEAVAEIKDNIFSNSAGAPVRLEYGAAYLLAGGGDGPGFYLCSAGTLAMNKAFLPSPMGAGAPKNMVLRNQPTTDILRVQRNASLNEDVYDLCGRRVENPKKGIYIVGGKKVIIK